VDQEPAKPKVTPGYVEFVQQSRKVLGLPEKPAPTERLNPELHELMQRAFSRLKAARLRKENP
jgi:hypothetical protein